MSITNLSQKWVNEMFQIVAVEEKNGESLKENFLQAPPITLLPLPPIKTAKIYVVEYAPQNMPIDNEKPEHFDAAISFLPLILPLHY